MKWLATWIMNRIAGDGCSEWALAMRREFEELDKGHLGWAFGCVGTICVKDVCENMPFLIAILISAYLMFAYYPPFTSSLVFYDQELYLSLFWTIDHLGQIPFAFALGFWRPTRAVTITLLGGFVGYTFGGILYVMHGFDGNFWDWLRGDVSYQVIGRGGENAYLATAIDLAVWYSAALAGGKLRGWFARRGLTKDHSASNP